MKLVTIPQYVFFGLPVMTMHMRDDGKCSVTIEDSADKCGVYIEMAVSAHHAELLSHVIDSWNAHTAVMDAINPAPPRDDVELMQERIRKLMDEDNG